MRGIKKTIVFLMTFIVSFGSMTFLSCDEKEEGGSSKPTTANISVRSADTTTKFRKNEVTSGDTDYKLEYNVVRNEYESYQLLISADADVSSYYLTTTDLKNGENTLAKENIEVYMQRYSNLSSGRDIKVYGEGDYPDALIPIDIAKEYEELTVTKDENSALWVTVYIPKNTVAGLYSGTFTLDVGGKKFDVPVSVNVNDYTLTDERNARTSFSWVYRDIGVGELNYSTEMLQAYYDCFADYRITLSSAVLDDPSVKATEFADFVVDNWDKMTSYIFSMGWGLGPAGLNEVRWESVKNQILAVAECSSPETNYLEKGMLYFMDEPQWTDERGSTYQPIENFLEKLRQLKADLPKIVEIIKNDKSGKYNNFKRIANWENYIIDMDNVIPIDIMKQISGRLDDPNIAEFLSLVNCLCPNLRNASDPDFAPLRKIMEEQYGIEIWWYGCTQPNGPYSSYHIGETNLLSGRTFTWIQKLYGIEGNLYWGPCGNTYYAGSVLGNPNIYDFPYRTPGYANDVAGDGFLVYPGVRYGVYGPLPSMRLMSIRDGNEEYELLHDLGKKIESLGDKNVTLQNELERLCDGLYYNGSMICAEGENNLDFYALRNELIELLVDFEDGTKFNVSSISRYNNEATVKLTANSDKYKLYYDNKELTLGSDGLYEVKLPLTQNGYFTFVLENKSTGEKIEKVRLIGTAVNRMLDFDGLTKAPTGDILLEEGDTCELNQDDNKTSSKNLKFALHSKITGSVISDQLFTPNFSIKTSILDVDFEKTTYFHVDLYNLNDDVDTVTIYLKSGAVECVYTTVKLQPGLNSIDVAMKGVFFSKLSTVDKIVFKFENKGTITSPYVHNVCLDNMYYV